MQQTRQPAPAVQAAKPRQPVAPPEFQEGAIATMKAAELIAIIKDASSSEFKKAKACQRLGELAAKEAVPALAALLGDEHLNTYARHGLEPIADASAGDALRAALPKLKGNQLIGVINSIGKRKDAKAEPALAKLVYSPDAGLARAAASALGYIGTPTAVKTLQAALPKTTGLVKAAVADGLLHAAEQLIAEGKRDQGLTLYASLSGADIPKPARLAAMNSIIREETAIARPK